MSHGDRTGPMGQGSKTGRAMGYCSGNDSPGYMTGIPAGKAWSTGRGAGRCMGRDTGRGAGRGFWCRRISGFGRGERFTARGEHPGYYYPAPAQTRAESNVDFLENRISSLKRELETLMESLMPQRSQERDEKE